MFERFTQQARDVISDADAQAKALGHQHVGPEHFMLAILGSLDSRVGEMLRGRGVSEDAFRARLVSRVGAGESEPLVGRPLPFTPRAKKVLELSLREALRLGTNVIATEHLLLAIAGEHEHFAIGLLIEGWGISLEEVRGAVIESLPSLELVPADRGVPVPRISTHHRGGAVLFDRFSATARQVITVARAEARGLGHNYVGSEHLLLGLLHDGDGIAGRVLRSRGLTSQLVRDEVVRTVGAGAELTTAQTLLTPRSKKVLQLAHAEALDLGHKVISAEHLLLGLLRENEGLGIRILRDHNDLDQGLDPEQIRTVVLEQLPGPDPD